jgi:protein gp37
VRCHPERLEQPLRWRKSQRVFVNSMSDLFHNRVPLGFIIRVMMIVTEARQHKFLVLTKRPERMLSVVRDWHDITGEDFTAFRGARGPAETLAAHPSPRGQLFAAYLEDLGKATGGKPPPGCAWPTFDWADGPMRWPTSPDRNLWLGVSVEDRAHLSRIDVLRKCPAVVRWISFEPLLEDVGRVDLTGISWVVVGCESGLGRRPMAEQWARGIIEQCRAAGVAVFFKQAERAGRVVTMPELDGRQYHEFPK